MSIKNKKGFTLIELVAVLVIMAIIALIVTPLVMNIIRKARIAADKRSVDAYGRSIELAIAGYLMDTGTFPTSISQLTIEYSGDEVVCSTTQLKSDSSIYLAGCTVGGRSVDYSYGTDKTPPAPTYTAYSVGDEVSYNNVDYYVIKDSGTSEANVTLLKKTPLTVSEVNTYGGVGTANNHVNMYNINSAYSYYRTAYDDGSTGYGGMAYYSSSTCGNGTYTGCTTDYGESEVKYVVDAWKTDKAPAATEARLITLNDLMELTDEVYYEDEETHEDPYFSLGYDWLRTDDEDNSYHVWTSTPYYSSGTFVWEVGPGESINTNGNLVQVWREYYMVRPVITISKTAISS